MTKLKKTTSKNEFDSEPTAAELQKARKVLRGYTLVVEPDDELTYLGWAKEMPTILADGSSHEGCINALTFALETAIATLISDRLAVPSPLASAKRTQQVNIRLTPYEKQLLTRESAKRGFRGVGDLIRAQTIERIVDAV